MNRLLFIVPVICCTAGVGRAGIVASGGAATLGPAPASVLLDAVESNTAAPVFIESENLTLSVGLPVDVTAAGTVDALGDLTPGVIPAGTLLNSYFLFSDPVGNTASTYEGFVEFDQPILGVIVTRDNLAASDLLVGNPGTTYGDFPARNLELGANSDRVVLSVSRFRLGFRFSTSSAADHVRVITAPTPGAAALLAAAGLVGARRRRA